MSVSVYVRVCMCVCVCMCVRVCMHACVCECIDYPIKVIDELFSGEGPQKHSKPSMCYGLTFKQLFYHQIYYLPLQLKFCSTSLAVSNNSTFFSADTK